MGGVCTISYGEHIKEAEHSSLPVAHGSNSSHGTQASNRNSAEYMTVSTDSTAVGSLEGDAVLEDLSDNQIELV